MNKQHDLTTRTQEARKEFNRQVSRYVLFSFLFLLINALTFAGHWWFIWPVFAWGMIVINQAFRVYGPEHYAEVEEREERRLYSNSFARRPTFNVDHHLELRDFDGLRPLQRRFERDLV